MYRMHTSTSCVPEMRYAISSCTHTKSSFICATCAVMGHLFATCRRRTISQEIERRLPNQVGTVHTDVDAVLGINKLATAVRKRKARL